MPASENKWHHCKNVPLLTLEQEIRMVVDVLLAKLYRFLLLRGLAPLSI